MSKEEVIGRKVAKASGVGTFHIGYGSDFLPPPRELIKTGYEVKHMGFGFNTSIWPTVSHLLHMGTNLGPGDRDGLSVSMIRRACERQSDFSKTGSFF